MAVKMENVQTTAKSRLLNDYRIEHKIGDSDNVYKCKHKINNKTFAIKKISISNHTQFQVKSIKNEVDIMKSLNHKYTIKYKQCYEDNDWLFIVMELCEGDDLFDHIKQEIRYTEKEATPIIKMVLEGLFYLHESKQIVHGDLKPDNILFVDKTRTSAIKIIDFGQSKIVNNSQKCVHGSMHGTYYYMAPESCNGEYTFSSDIWSIGIILFVMVFGYQPFGLNESKYTNKKMLGQAIRKLVENGFDATVKNGYGPWFPKRIRVSFELKDLIAKLLEYDATKRLTVKQALEHPWIKNNGRNVNSIKPMSLLKSIWNRLV